MTRKSIGVAVAVFGLTSSAALAQNHEGDRGREAAPRAAAPAAAAPRAMAPRGVAPQAPVRGSGWQGMRQGEVHQGPSGYQRPTEPQGWNQRPAQADSNVYQHNFRAPRSFHIGPYSAPRGYAYRRWGYGDILPRAFWAPPYLIADYWLFGLEVAPAGYEWVRYGPDALLVNTYTGQVLQVEYGVFAY